MQQTRQTRHVKRRRNEGLCGWSGCDEVTGDATYYCERHRAHYNKLRRVRASLSRLKTEEDGGL